MNDNKNYNSSFGAFLDGMNRGEDCKRAYSIFHKLWGDAHDNDNYNKSEWSELYVLLSRVIDEKPFKI